MGQQLLSRHLGAFRPLGMNYGPTGARVPWYTPAYSTAASTQVASFAALQTALNTASSGQVIEYTPAVGDTGTLALTGGSPLDGSNNLTWASNVLIRPPLGTRATLPMSTLSIQARGVTLAGYDLGAGTIQIDNGADTFNGKRSALWRILGIDQDFYFRNVAAADAQFVEVVSPKRRVGLRSTSNEDRCNILSHNTTDCLRTRMWGCYIAGSQGGPSGNNAAITAPAASATVANPTNGQTLLSFTAPGALTYASFLTGCNKIPHGSSISVAWKVNGVTQFTHVVPATNIYVSGSSWATQANNDFAKNDATAGAGAPASLVLNVNDVLTCVVTAITGTVPSVYVGAGYSSGLHEDTLQSYCANSSTGLIKGLILAESVLDDCDNSAGQFEAMGDDVLLYKNWHGVQRSYSTNLNDLASGGYSSRWHIHRCLFAGKAPTIDANLVQLFKQNLYLSVPSWKAGSFTPDATNVLDATLPVARPALPDLSVIWPECPHVGDPT